MYSLDNNSFPSGSLHLPSPNFPPIFLYPYISSGGGGGGGAGRGVEEDMIYLNLTSLLFLQYLSLTK